MTPLTRAVIWVTFALTMIVVWLGTVVTGSGPHSGDHGAARTGFDIEFVARIHALSAWALLAGAIVCLILARRAGAAWMARWAIFLVLVVLGQAVVGYIQYFTGLPIGVVIAHMVGTTLVTLAASGLAFSTRAVTKP